MKRLSLSLAAFAALALPVLAATDPIAARKTLMDGVAANAGVAGGVMKGEIAYSPAVGKAVIESMAGVALVYGDYFPEGTDTGDTKASPKIWSDRAGFDAELAKFQAAVAAAREASGREGPADQAAFAAAIQPVLGTCRACHEGYRLAD